MAAPLADLQSCADYLTAGGHWSNTSEWLAHSRHHCALAQSHVHARTALRDRWILVVGDSRVRFIYAALLQLINGSLPYEGWPTHRVPDGDACTPHVPAHDGIGAQHGWYNPACQARWKGPCWDDMRGRNVMNVCTLDYRLPSRGIRLTFQWHSLNEGLYLRALKARLALLYAHAQRAPDLIVGSSTAWDMQYGSSRESGGCCCDTLTSFARTLRKDYLNTPTPSPAPLTVLYGLFNCPTCASKRYTSCAHIKAPRPVQELTARTHACGRNVSRAHGMVYLDVQSMTNTVPSLLSSPCINNHAFGVLAEAQAAAIVGLFRFSRPPPSPPDVTNASWLWSAWQPMGTSLRCVVGSRCESRAEPMVRSDASPVRSTRPHGASVSTRRKSSKQPSASAPAAASDWIAGYCRPTTRGGSCTADDHGSWDLPREVQEADTELGSHEVAKGACMDMCRRCANCGYVSVSESYNDCSWFRGCDLGGLKHDVAGFVTARIAKR